MLPMLAGSAADVARGPRPNVTGGVEWKLDGARIQVHRAGYDVGVFTRSLDDFTARMPGVVADHGSSRSARQCWTAKRSRCAKTAGRTDFKYLRFGAAGPTFATPFLFDILHRDGTDLLDGPARNLRRS